MYDGNGTYDSSRNTWYSRPQPPPISTEPKKKKKSNEMLETRQTGKRVDVNKKNKEVLSYDLEAKRQNNREDKYARRRLAAAAAKSRKQMACQQSESPKGDAASSLLSEINHIRNGLKDEDNITHEPDTRESEMSDDDDDDFIFGNNNPVQNEGGMEIDEEAGINPVDDSGDDGGESSADDDESRVELTEDAGNLLWSQFAEGEEESTTAKQELWERRNTDEPDDEVTFDY